MARFAPVDWCVFGKEVIPSEQRYYLFQAFIGTSKPKVLGFLSRKSEKFRSIL